ncbi:MAG: methyltransferase domain-containing protein [Chitinophagia bacterium]|nr:methyltransferase domain-containing protein [Chitinophagia bacterium]
MSDQFKHMEPADDGFGFEVSASYADAHEALLCAEIRNAVDAGQSITVLDLACGIGATSVRLAQAGAHVIAIDLNPKTKAILEKSAQSSHIQFVQADIRQLPKFVHEQKFDYILFQRALDCMPGSDGIQMLRHIEKMLKRRGRLYLTVSSPEADYAIGYDGTSKSLKERFDKLSPHFQAMHHFFRPICMWHKAELASVLKRQDWKIVSHYLSKSGSNKVIAGPQHWLEKKITHVTVAITSVAAAWVLAATQLLVSPFSTPENAQNKTVLSANVASAIGNSSYYAVNEIGNDGTEETLIASDATLMDRNKANYLQSSVSRWPMQRREIGNGLAVYYEPRYRPAGYTL